jgi:hypothetical protein
MDIDKEVYIIECNASQYRMSDEVLDQLPVLSTALCEV